MKSRYLKKSIHPMSTPAFCMFSEIPVNETKVLCIQWEFGSHFMLKTGTSNFVMMIQRSVSLYDDDTYSQRCFRQKQ
jgi:hypothetical protein